MSDLATVADLEARLPRALSTEEQGRVPALLRDASAGIRNYTGQYLNQDTTTERVRVSKNDVVHLSQRPVVAVAAVTDPFGTAVPYTWLGDDVLELTSWALLDDGWAYEPRRFALRAVDVRYTHGYATVPDDIVGICCSITLRALGTLPTLGGITSETIASYSYSVGAAASSGGFGLLRDERETLDRYRRVVGRIEMGRR
jgi:hypothetical protein